MPVSPLPARSATAGLEKSPLCDECGQSRDPGHSTYVAGFGNFHAECVTACPCSWAWPRSLVETGEVIFYCGTCALAAGRDELL